MTLTISLQTYNERMVSFVWNPIKYVEGGEIGDRGYEMGDRRWRMKDGG
jgi:hypothetical protein